MNGRTEGDEVRPGDVLAGRYRIVELLGQGGMGLVFSAVDARGGTSVAIKVPRNEVRGRKKVLARFERESRAAGKLHGPHVVRVTDVAELADGTPFMVMELLAGRDLASELVARGRLPLGEAVGYVLEAAAGVAEAHAAGIVHRDLKPHNLFLVEGASGRTLKVLDFGISKLAGSDVARMTTTNARLGTPLYVSPEQLLSPKHVDGRTDIWSLGVILYEVVTGVPPFTGPTALAVASAIQHAEPIPPSARVSGLPVELDRVVLRALSKDIRQRFQRVEDFAAALAGLGSGRSPGARVAAPPPAPRLPDPESPGATHADTPREPGAGQARSLDGPEVGVKPKPARSARDLNLGVLLLLVLAAVFGVGLLALTLASH